MKKILILTLLLTAGLAQITPPITISPAELMRLCARTGGTWNSTIGKCECPEGFEFDQEKGCWNARAKELCERTRGVWYVDNTKSPPLGKCDCGLGKTWDDQEGCTGGLIQSIVNFIKSLIPSYLTGG